MITVAYFDKNLKKHEKLTLYSEDNTSLTIVKKYHLTTEPDRKTYFDVECKDLEKFCSMMGLTLKPNN